MYILRSELEDTEKDNYVRLLLKLDMRRVHYELLREGYRSLLDNCWDKGIVVSGTTVKVRI